MKTIPSQRTLSGPNNSRKRKSGGKRELIWRYDELLGVVLGLVQEGHTEEEKSTLRASPSVVFLVAFSSVVLDMIGDPALGDVRRVERGVSRMEMKRYSISGLDFLSPGPSSFARERGDKGCTRILKMGFR